MSRRLATFGATAAAGGVGYYLYSAGGDPKLAEKKAEHDAATATRRMRGDFPGQDKEAKKAGEEGYEAVRASAQQYADQAKAEARKAEQKLDSMSTEARRKYEQAKAEAERELHQAGKQVNATANKFDAVVEDKAAKTSSWLGSWFGGKISLPTKSTVTKTLTHGCIVCNKHSQLSTCGKCKIVQYCGRDHQAADWPNHKALCKNIGRKRAELEAEQEEERMFSALAGNMSTALPMGADAAVLLKLGHAELDVGTRVVVVCQERCTHAYVDLMFECLANRLGYGVHVRQAPPELVDEIRKNMVSSAISKQLIERDDHQEDIARVKADVKTLYDTVKVSNIHFWPAVLHPGDNLTAEAEGWYYGNKEEMQFALQFTYRAWVETLGAIEAIEVLSKEP